MDKQMARYLKPLIGSTITGLLSGGDNVFLDVGFSVRCRNGVELNVWVLRDPDSIEPGWLNIELKEKT